MSVSKEFFGSGIPLSDSFWEVDRNDPSARQTDQEVSQQMQASGIDMSGGLDRMLASMGQAFGDPLEIIAALCAEIPEEYLERLSGDPDSLNIILEEISLNQ